MKRWAVLSALIACSPSAPDEAGVPEAYALASAVIPDNVTRSVEDLATGHDNDEKVPCEGYSPKDHFPACELSRNAAMASVTGALRSFGYDPRTVELGNAPTAMNVVAEHRGEDRPNEVVLLAAHLDAFYAGADDNSSGVAALIEAARVTAPRRFSRTIRFVAFDLEEYGDVGSTRYVAAGMARDVVFALVLECVGYASNAPGSQDGLPGLPLGDVGDFLMVVANGDSLDPAQRLLAFNHKYGLMSMKGIAAGASAWFPLTSALTRSDNGPFWLEGIPALMLTDTADLRNPHYHEREDTPATLSASFLAGSTQIAVATVALFGGLLP